MSIGAIPVPVAPALPVAQPVIPPPPDPLAVESLVASIGLLPFVSNSITKVHQYQAERAAKVQAEIAAKIHRFLARKEPAEPADLPPFDFEAVVAELDTESEGERDPAHVVREIAAFGEDNQDMAVAANLVVQRIKAAVIAKIPRRVRQSLAGPEKMLPPHSDVARFRRLWVVACDPLSVLDDLNEFALSRDQIEVCATLYPLVWGEFFPIAQQQLARRKAVNPKWQLTHRKEQLLRVLCKQEAPNVPLGQALQAMFKAQAAEAQQPAAGGPAAKGGGASDESSAADRIDV
jgi:hypothetical protein